MSEHHGHSHDLSGIDAPERVARAVWISVIAVGVLALLGAILLWPSGDTSSDTSFMDTNVQKAEVLLVEVLPCTGTTEADGIDCRWITISVGDQDDRGVLEQSVDGIGARLEEGDRILVSTADLGNGTTVYGFHDYQRGTPLLLLLVIFVIAVLLLGRWRGLGAVAGLGASLVVLIVFMLPSLLDGNSPIIVAIVGSVLIAYIAIFLAHGVNVASAVALLSTFLSLTLTGVLGWLFVTLAKFTGYSDENSYYLDVLGLDIDARGVILAGIVIGSLGVLDDVTVTQVSAVWELRRSNPSGSWTDVFRPAMTIGRDHVSSTVNTLFLAYAGASLPLLLLFTQARQSTGSIVGKEVVAVEVVRSLVGSIGLVASVPISTALAAMVVGATTDRKSR